MKKITLYILLFLLTMPAWAQKEEKSSYNKEKLESAKVAFITKRLDLTSDQAEKFWPLYNQHSENKRRFMRSMKDLVENDDEEVSNQKARELIAQKFEMEQKILDLEKAFLMDIIKVISPVQALKLGDANRDFTRHIYHMQKRKKNPAQ